MPLPSREKTFGLENCRNLLDELEWEIKQLRRSSSDVEAAMFIAFNAAAGVKRGERVYVIGEATKIALKKAHALVATVSPDEAISYSNLPTRNFPPPWKVERIPGGFVVKDANGQQLAHIYADSRQIVNTLTRRDASRAISLSCPISSKASLAS